MQINEPLINTLRGPVPLSHLGRILVHEHVFCRVRDSQLPVAREFLRQQLERIVEKGVGTIVDLTTYVLPDEFYEVAAGIPDLNVICCAGYYLNSRIPPAFRTLESEGLTERLLRKFTNGIGKSRVIPGIIKVASSGRTLTRLEREILHAAANVQREINVPIATHACRGGRVQVEELLKWGANPKKIFLSHLEMELKGNLARPFGEVASDVFAILKHGAFVFFGDFTATESRYRQDLIRLVKGCVDRGYLSQILLSTDSYWSCRNGEVKVRGSSLRSRTPRTYEYIFTVILPTLQEAGFTKQQLREILDRNPVRFFSPEAFGSFEQQLLYL